MDNGSDLLFGNEELLQVCVENALLALDGVQRVVAEGLHGC